MCQVWSQTAPPAPVVVRFFCFHFDLRRDGWVSRAGELDHRDAIRSFPLPDPLVFSLPQLSAEGLAGRRRWSRGPTRCGRGSWLVESGCRGASTTHGHARHLLSHLREKIKRKAWREESGEESEGERYPGAKDGKLWKSFGFSVWKGEAKPGMWLGGPSVLHI